MNDARLTTPHTRRRAARACACACALLLVAASLAAVCQAQATAAQLPPVISKVTPQTAAPGVAVGVEGVRLGLEGEREKVSVLFLQNGREFKAETGGSSYQENDSGATQELLAYVPEELAAGPCKVVVEVDGRRSEPFPMEIGANFEAPVITHLDPVWVIPGEHIWVHGSGFTGKETAELTDSAGEVRRVEKIGVTSDADTVSFRLPEDVAEGDVSIRLIETRSGMDKASGALTLKVTRGVAPLQPALGWLKPVAPGQWLSLTVYGNLIYDRITRVDVSFTQDGQTHTTTAPEPRPPRVQVPPALRPGPVELRTRAWVGDVSSAWSDPYPYEVARSPLAPIVYSVEVVPVRAEAQLRQQGQVVATVPVAFESQPRARVPGHVKSNEVEVRMRAWRGGRPGEWSAASHFTLDPSSPQGRTLTLLPLAEPTYVGPDAPESLLVYGGEGLMLRGDFHTASVAEMQVFIAQPGQRVELRPEPVRGAGGGTLVVRLPRTLAPGLWQLTVQGGATQTELPIKLLLK